MLSEANKNKLMIVGILIGFLFLVTPTYSFLEQYEVTTTINTDFSTNHEINLVFFNQTSKSFKFQIEDFIYNLNSTSSAGAVDCRSSENPLGTEITCDLGKITETRYSIVIKYASREHVKSIDKYFVFKESHVLVVDSKRLVISLKLPEGFVLLQPKNETLSILPYTPSFGSVGTDGRRIVLVWQKDNLKAGDGIDVSVAYESLMQEDRYSQLIAIFTGSTITLLLIIVLMGGGFWYFWKKFRKDVKIVLPVLKKDEKIVMEVLLKYSGVANQKIIVKESNYSKAKVSKVLKSLAERGLVRLERIGRTNKVLLEKQFKREEDKK